MEKVLTEANQAVAYFQQAQSTLQRLHTQAKKNAKGCTASASLEWVDSIPPEDTSNMESILFRIRDCQKVIAKMSPSCYALQGMVSQMISMTGIGRGSSSASSASASTSTSASQASASASASSMSWWEDQSTTGHALLSTLWIQALRVHLHLQHNNIIFRFTGCARLNTLIKMLRTGLYTLNCG